jgi:hypothetical protein
MDKRMYMRAIRLPIYISGIEMQDERNEIALLSGWHAVNYPACLNGNIWGPL